MSRHTQIYLLVALLAVLVALVAYNWRSPEMATVLSADENFQPLKVENPELRRDLLDKIHKREYSRTHRNIFSAAPPPPPQPDVTKKNEQETPPPPPPLEVPFKFFGYATDPQTGKRRGFFTTGDDVFIVSEGETLLNRFRLLKIGNTTAEVEETQSGRRATLQMEQPATPPG